MKKLLVLGFSATTNMILAGVGGAIVGMGALKAIQSLSDKKTAQPKSDRP